MDRTDFKDPSPALALDALGDSERAACASHLMSAQTHDGCRETEPQVRRVAARLAGVLPDYPVHPRVWQAIEQRLQVRVAVAPAALSRRPRWREISGWLAAAVAVGLGLYLHKVPTIAVAMADAAVDSRRVSERAATLMMDRQMRRYLFWPAKAGNARAALIVAPSFRGALILIDRVTPPPPGHELHLWAVRGPVGPPALLTRIGLGKEGSAVAEVGATLFDPALSGQLLLSTDPAGASAPTSVMLVSNFDARDTGTASAAGDQPQGRDREDREDRKDQPQAASVR
jgi:hypothetical protein